MRFIKLAIISIVVLALLSTGMSLLLPSQVFVIRTITLQASPDKVYNYLNDLRNWPQWCANMDSANIAYGSRTVGEKAFMTLDQTRITIDSSNPTHMMITWQPRAGKSLLSVIDLQANKNATVTDLQWQFVHKVGWLPWQKLSLLLTDKAIGSYMEKSLDKLKSVIVQ